MLFRPLMLLAAAVLLAAQNPYGRMTGRVVDSSNAYVAGAAARVVQLETNIVTSTTTNQEGVYELLNLLPGQYQLIVERRGSSASSAARWRCASVTCWASTWLWKWGRFRKA